MQALPRAAEKYQASQSREIAAALAAVRRLWRQVLPVAVLGSWGMVRPSVVAALVVAQERLLSGVEPYMSAVLAETGQGRRDDPVGAPGWWPLLGVAGDGRGLGGMVDGAAYGALRSIREGAAPRLAVREAGRWLERAASTALSDTARQGEVVAMARRPVAGYVRMLVPPSCSRCALLAGKFYRFNDGFHRHERCDCRHIPASEALAGDLALDTRVYFESLPTAAEVADRYPHLSRDERRRKGIYSQEEIFTVKGTEAIRDGADIGRVVNARRGMYTAQVGGRRVLATTAVSGSRVRLMPETIVRVAPNRAERLRLLRLHGYITG